MEILPFGNLMEALSQIAQSGSSFTEKDAASLIHQILYAVRYMHEEKKLDRTNDTKMKHAHRDLKLENILVKMIPNNDGTCQMFCKISDFGFATSINSSASLD